MNQKIMALRKEQGGINKYEENNEHLNKTIKILQNKLEQVNIYICIFETLITLLI